MPSVISADSPGHHEQGDVARPELGVEVALDRGTRERAGAADLLEDPLGAGVELVVGHDLAHEAHRARRVGVDLGRGEEQVPRPGQADDVDQARRHVRVGQAAQQLGHAEAGPVGRDGHVAVQREVEPAGDGTRR